MFGIEGLVKITIMEEHCVGCVSRIWRCHNTAPVLKIKPFKTLRKNVEISFPMHLICKQDLPEYPWSTDCL